MIPQYDEFGNPIYDETPWEPVVTLPQPAYVPPPATWTDPDNAPPDWLHNPHASPPYENVPPGNFWTWDAGLGRWDLKPSIRDTDPNPGVGGAPGSQTGSSGAPYPPTTGGDYHLPTGGPGNVGGGGYPGSIGYDPSGFQWPTLDIPEYTNPYGDYTPTEWVAPKPEDVHKDPSYQFRLDESMKPMVNQRALQGLTRGGATMKALAKYAGGFASDEFGRIYDRAADTYDRVEKNRKGAFDTNVDNWNTGYGYKVDEAKLEFAPKFDAAKLQFAQNFDIWKYLNDDVFRYYNADLNASTQGSQFGNDEP